MSREILDYWAGNITTSGANNDIFDAIKTATGKDRIFARQVTVISAGSFTFKTNGAEWTNTPYLDTDSKYKFSVNDTGITSIIVVEDAITLHVSVLFT